MEERRVRFRPREARRNETQGAIASKHQQAVISIL